MLVQELDRAYEQDWDDFVWRNPGGTFYHSVKWKEVIERSFPYRPLYLMIRDESGRTVGVCPAFLVELARMKLLYSTPCSDYAGPLVAEDCTQEAALSLIEYLHAVAGKKSIAYSKIMLIDDRVASILRSPQTSVDVGTGVMEVDLKKTRSDLIWLERISKNTRKRIRSIEGKGFHAVQGQTRSDLQTFYHMYQTSMRHVGVSPVSREFLETMWSRLHPEHIRLWFLERENRVAATLYLQDERASYAYMSAVDREQNVHEAINFLRWTEIRTAEEEGRSCVSFGLTPSDPMHPQHAQKARIGGTFREQKIIWYPFSLMGRIVTQARPRILLTWKAVRGLLPLTLRSRIENRGTFT